MTHVDGNEAEDFPYVTTHVSLNDIYFVKY